MRSVWIDYLVFFRPDIKLPNMNQFKHYLLLGLAYFLYNPLFSQGLDFGVKAGVNAVKIDNMAFEDGFNYGFMGGAYLHVNLKKKFGFGADLIFSEATMKTANDIDQVVGEFNAEELKDVKLNYLGVPLYMNIGGKFRVQLGAQFNMKLNESEVFTNSVREIFSSNDIQGLVGFQWNLPLHLFVNGRYLAGLSDINDITKSNEWKSQTIQVGAGFRF